MSTLHYLLHFPGFLDVPKHHKSFYFFDLSGDVSLDMTSATPIHQETEFSREQRGNVSKKQGLDTREATELMAANAFHTADTDFVRD